MGIYIVVLEVGKCKLHFRTPAFGNAWTTGSLDDKRGRPTGEVVTKPKIRSHVPARFVALKTNKNYFMSMVKDSDQTWWTW